MFTYAQSNVPFDTVLINIGYGDDFYAQIFDEEFLIGIDISEADVSETLGVDDGLYPIEAGQVFRSQTLTEREN